MDNHQKTIELTKYQFRIYSLNCQSITKYNQQPHIYEFLILIGNKRGQSNFVQHILDSEIIYKFKVIYQIIQQQLIYRFKFYNKYQPVQFVIQALTNMQLPMITKKKIQTLYPFVSTAEKQHSSDAISDLCRSVKALTIKIDNLMDESSKKQNFQRVQQRFQSVKIKIPNLIYFSEQNAEQRKFQIQKWLGKLCQQVFSVTFSMFQQQKLNQRKAKAFFCQNMISNIISMVKKNQLNTQQISVIDKCLKQQLIPYFLIKYPMSQQAEVNLQFASKIMQTDGIKANENDLVYRSQVQFNFKEDANYNRQIMKLINYVIQLPNKKCKEKGLTLFKQFYSDMEAFFKNVQQQNFTLYMNNYDPRSQSNLQINQKWNKEIGEISIEQQKQKEKYRQNVRSYTKKLIGRKISQNVKAFTQIQINQGELIFKSPSIMRIVTKWCDELMQNFDVVPNILNRQEQFRMRDGGQKILKRKHLLILSQLLIREKNKVKDYLKKVNKNNSISQFDFISQKIPKQLEKFSQNQCEVGFFSASQIRNYQTYLVGYVNTIIHALMSATKDYQQMVKAYQYEQQQYGKYIQSWRKNQITFQDLINKAYSYRLVSVPVSYISLIPQLVSFRVGDIMRCKCTSKQKQIIALYTELQRLSRDKSCDLKITNIKNRLQKGTKDILINILYKNTMVVQMQLAVTTSRSKFIDFSNKFNHILYQLRRAQFGPISQMCNIWMNNDIKSQFYSEKVKQYNQRKVSHQSNEGHICKGRIIQYPFRCSLCSYFYTDCSYVLKHIQCEQKNCLKYLCSLCQAQMFTYNQINQKFNQIPQINVLGMHASQKYWEYKKRKLPQLAPKFIFQNKQNAGIIIDLKGEDKKPKICKAFYSGKKYIILHIQNLKQFNVKVLKQLRNQYDVQKFKKQYLIFQSEELVQKIRGILSLGNENRIITQFYFPKLAKKWSQKQKSTIVFMQGQLQDTDIQKMNYNYHYATKLCLYNNKLQNFQAIVNKFDFAQILDLGENKIKNLLINKKQINSFQFKVIYLNYNNISQINENFIQKFKNLQELQLANNQLTQLPSNFGKLNDLKIINLSRNKFVKLPQQITSLSQLQVLNLYSSNSHKYKICQLPQSIGQLKVLRKLNINLNSIKKFPDSFGNLSSLQILYAMKNDLQHLPQSFKNLHNLKILNLAHNKFKDIPEQIGSLDKLEVLNFQNASKYKIDQKRLPDSFCNLKNIKMMDVSNNQICHLPKNIGNLQRLQTLFIYQNNIRQIPESIGNLKLLRLLYTSNNLYQKLPSSICQLQNLQKLTLKQCMGLKNLPENFGKLKKLKYLICSGSGLEQLPHSFGELANLTQLMVTNTKISRIPEQTIRLKNLCRFQINIENLDKKSKQIYKTIVKIEQNSKKTRASQT